jgi:parvulin-like peptidyl-prolyl isomerase
MNAALAAAAFVLPEGRYTEPVEHNGRYFIILVEEHRAERVVPLADVQPEIEVILANDLSEKRYREWIEKLKQKCFIERHLETIDEGNSRD